MEGRTTRGHLHAGRLVACAFVVAAACFLITSSLTAWVNTSSPVRLNLGSGGSGLNLTFGSSGSLSGDGQGFLIGVASFMTVAVLLTLVPYLRVFALAVLASGAAALLLGLGALVTIREPSGSSVLDQIRDKIVQHSPAAGVYLCIIGGSLAVIGGLLTLLTPRTTAVAIPSHVPPSSVRDGPI